MGRYSEAEDECAGALAEIKSCSSSDPMQIVQEEEEEEEKIGRRPVTRQQRLGVVQRGEEEFDESSSSSDDGETGGIQESTNRISTRERASGRWSVEEHEEFLRCLRIYGREWKKVSQRITTRTAAQIRSHAQKYFKKIEEEEAAAAAAAVNNQKKNTWTGPTSSTGSLYNNKPGESSSVSSSYSSENEGRRRSSRTSSRSGRDSRSRQPTIDEAVAEVDQVLGSLQAKRARCYQAAAEHDQDHYSDDRITSSEEKTPDATQRVTPMTTAQSRKRVVSCDDLKDNELIALEMLCRHSAAPAGPKDVSTTANTSSRF